MVVILSLMVVKRTSLREGPAQLQFSNTYWCGDGGNHSVWLESESTSCRGAEPVPVTRLALLICFRILTGSRQAILLQHPGPYLVYVLVAESSKYSEMEVRPEPLAQKSSTLQRERCPEGVKLPS